MVLGEEFLLLWSTGQRSSPSSSDFIMKPGNVTSILLTHEDNT